MHEHTDAEVLVALFNLFKNQYTNLTNGLIPNPHDLSSYLNIITRAAVNSSGYTGEKVAFQRVVSIDKRYMKYDVLTYFMH